jgi:hypothetical protein
MGALRYGRLREIGKVKYDRLGSIKKRLDLYIKTGNDELLVDISNLCMLEFEEGVHPNKHFNFVDDGEHVSIEVVVNR